MYFHHEDSKSHLLMEEESCTDGVAAESAGVLSFVALSIGVAAVPWSPVFSDDDVHEARIRSPPRKMAAANGMILFFIDQFI